VVRRLAFSLLLGALLAAGCGGKGTVSGTVTVKGEPVTIGRIIFHPSAASKTVFASTIRNGKYEITDCPTGPVQVAVVSFAPKPKSPAKEPPKNPKTPPQTAPIKVEGEEFPPDTKFVVVPTKYGNPEKSGVTYEVKSGSQTQNFDLAP